MRFEMEESKDFLITHTGIVLVGELLAQTTLYERLNEVKIPDVQSGNISSAAMAFSYIGLLCQGKTAYDAVEEFRGDDFFKKSLDINKVPSSAILRQRFDKIGASFNEILMDEGCKLVKNVGAVITPCYGEHVALDVDVSPFDNSKTKKEGVSYTYKGFDGFSPIFAYLGNEGYCVDVEFRSGSTHCQCNTEAFLKDAILNAKKITDQPLLVRMDSGNDSVSNIIVMQQDETEADFIIKRNLRRENRQAYYVLATENGKKLESPREGKEVYISEHCFIPSGATKKVRVINHITRRTTTPDGQILIEPTVEVDAYYTSLYEAPATDVIEQYHAHGTSEQFHSEIKSDLDLERLPSGKFDTNDLILHLGVFAYNILKLIGQESLKEADTPPTQHGVKRRRVRTVIQNYMTIASKLVYHAKKWCLKFGCNSPWFVSFKRIYQTLCCG